MTIFFNMTSMIWADEGREILLIRRKNQALISSSNPRESSNEENNNSSTIEKSGQRKFDLLQIALRFSKIAYFAHTIIVLRYYSQTREPVDILSLQKVRKLLVPFEYIAILNVQCSNKLWFFILYSISNSFGKIVWCIFVSSELFPSFIYCSLDRIPRS